MSDNELLFSIIMMVGVLLFVKMIIASVIASIRYFHDNKQHWGKNAKGIPPMFQKMTDKAMSERDEEMDLLRERIEVLEAIVTDQHNQSKARELADEIDDLRK